MENLQNMSKYQKQEILFSWIRNMDEFAMDDLLIEHFDYEYEDIEDDEEEF